jgi:glycogen(starch) synthase
MSILVVAPRYAPDAGGIETLLAHVLPELTVRGLEFVVAAGTDRQDLAPFEVRDGIPVHRVPFGTAVLSADPGDILRAGRRLRDIEREHEVTARHLQGFGDIDLWYLLRLHRRTPLPLAVSVHGTFDDLDAWGGSAYELLRIADVATAVSEPVRRSVLRAVPELAGRVELIRNGLRLDGVEPTPWPTDGYLLGVGRLLEQKGFDVAVDALARLRTTHPRLELVIAGTGPGEAQLRDQATRLGIADRVRLLGRIPHDEVLEVLTGAAAVLVPSRNIEGFSLAALEAAHAGRPVIASRVGGLAETIDDGVTGLLVPPCDPASLASAIDSLLSDPARAATMGEAARRRAQERFTFDRCVDGYHRLYEALDPRPLSLVSADR